MTARRTTAPSPSLGEPVRISGRDGAWDQVRADLEEHEVAVLHARLADWRPDRAGGPRLRALLGRDWDRYLEMTHPDVRTRFAASRVLLKFSAAVALRVPPQAVELGYGPTGRPYLRGYDAVDISLSHTDDLLLIGLATKGLIGVDAERADRPLYTRGLHRHVCTPHELTVLERLPAARRGAALVRMWTLKEAYSKAIGQGLRFRFTDFGFSGDGRPARVLAPDGAPGTGVEWQFRTFSVDGGFVVSVAVSDAGFGGTRDTDARTMLDPRVVAAVAEALGDDADGDDPDGGEDAALDW
ncbi:MULTISPECIES: 4'-phosphopantetheinyl transferase family protein [Streptomyces]|uniref:4'-phosphopantetheinyl transferase family protein n=1 Tax=Streptomyces TaxID=1883 RepID=UPI0004E729F9|nr:MULTISPECIES: 4'-phosphopantetheinyl transferase superfamily protein [Streptomyces]MBP5863877.1 4'-phosphopantetheinyl transferase superfamily protein [Streptomyces sp. LBUM 1484]MBP5875502.1 4'-phosphopantetheinyl transferase superfamily protein [Streptomyces sp. LBUM 1477]MBP5883321.1 4'-phosphopantetheinyl transferase superfamily protein [Streptomyces sp. LBUM 1487]MBP5899344.1 4'-phosphopantetheinyl transferase superfamily protein [Streptomyces sp. LBUM 1488]QTU45774.1 4'-phosphopanteth